MEDFYIKSRQNDQIKNLVKLRERKHRDRQSRFLIEGHREIVYALRAGIKITHMYYCPEFFPNNTLSVFIDRQKCQDKYPVIRLSSEALTKASYREGPDGIIAVAIQQKELLSNLNISEKPLLLVLEGIEKPGNLGAILRSADGAGVDAVVLVDCVLDLYNPNAIRSSQGLLFTLPIVSTKREPLVKWLNTQNIACCATNPLSNTLHWDVDFIQGIALLMGSESHGLSSYWLKKADYQIRLPMLGSADSLNVAAAAAICLYEALRQRNLTI